MSVFQMILADHPDWRYLFGPALQQNALRPMTDIDGGKRL